MSGRRDRGQSKSAAYRKARAEHLLAGDGRWEWAATDGFRDFLYERQGGICGWCHEPLDGRMDVDHSHDCPKHLPVQSEQSQACPHCLRALVHRRCNVGRLRDGISFWDAVLDLGAREYISDSILAYLEPWRNATEVTLEPGQRWAA